MRAGIDWRLAAATGGAAGLAASPFWQPGGEWVRALLVAVIAVAVLVERGRAGLPALVLIGLAAAMAGLLAGGARLAEIDRGALSAGPGPVALVGFAIEPPSDSRGIARFAFESDRGRLLVESSTGLAAEVSLGSGLSVKGRLEAAPSWMAGDLERRGIAMVLRAKEIRLDGEHRDGAAGLIDRLRDRAFEALEAAVPQREAALSRGFVLGDDSDVDARTVEDFRRSGLSHLMAASGQNVVLLGLLAIPILSLLGIGPRARLLAIAGLILIYVPLAGGGPSIQRAGVMGIAGLLAAAATRASSRAYALMLAALATLALNPRATADVGWQLSFAAVIGIMLLARPFQARLAPLIGNGGWRGALTEGLAVTLAATIATAPLTAFHFERLPVATLIANLAAMPAVAPAMWLGMIAIAAGQLSPVLAVPFNLAGSLFLAWIAQVAEWFGRPDWAVVEVTVGGVWGLALVTVLLGLIVLATLGLWRAGRAPVPPRRWVPAAALVLLLAVLLGPQLIDGGRRHLGSPPPGGARIEVLDVGQGDAILIRPWNADPILVDGGPPDGDLAGALDSAGVDHLAAAMLTHPDLDHYGGLMGLFGLIPVDRFLFDRAPPELVSLARSAGTQLDRVEAGERLRDGDVRLELLWPPGDGGPAPVAPDESETNLRSIVALLSYRGFRMLLTGDAEAESVPIDPGPIDVLKVSHHGSEDAGLPALLDESNPQLAVISVGKGNRYGHPVPEVLNELADDQVQTLRTDEDGTISIVIEPGGRFQLETGR